jgi:hypothetical protein
MPATTNTEFRYMYRDGANYKFGGRIVVRGTITDDLKRRLQSSLDDGANFIARQVGIPDVFPWETGDGEYDDEVDHSWHEFNAVERTNEAATDSRSVSELVAAFEAQKQAGWRCYEPV